MITPEFNLDAEKRWSTLIKGEDQRFSALISVQYKDFKAAHPND